MLVPTQSSLRLACPQITPFEEGAGTSMPTAATVEISTELSEQIVSSAKCNCLKVALNPSLPCERSSTP